MRPGPAEAARLILAARYPDADSAIAGGSAIRGEGSATSDIDLLVVIPALSAPYRESSVSHGWPVEAFVNNLSSYRRFFEADAERRRPALARLCAEGVILRDSGGTGMEIREEAGRLLAAGPRPLTAGEMARMRYRVTDLLDDLAGATTQGEAYFAANALVTAAVDLRLSSRRHWLGHGKWMHRELHSLDPDLADRLLSSLQRLYVADDRQPLARWVEEVLTGVGGRLFEGYREEGSRVVAGGGRGDQLRLDHVALAVSSQSASCRFYQKYLGFLAESRRVAEDGTWLLPAPAGGWLALGSHGVEWEHFGVAVPSPDAVRDLRGRLEADQVPIVEESDEAEYVSVKFRDLDGHQVEAYWEPG